MSVFKGAGTALVTPFNEKGINFDVFEELIEYQLDGGIDALIVCGTTGEAATMTSEETQAAIDFVVKKTKGRVPVIAGTGCNCTASAVENSKAAADMGADALLVVNPYYNKGSRSGVYKHYAMIADAAKTPIIVYNVPSRTGCNLSPDFLAELADIDQVVGLKAASSDICQIADIAANLGDKIDIYSGNDDQIMPLLSLGGSGVISTIGNIAPGATSDIPRNFFAGNIDAAIEGQLKMIPVIRALFNETNPTPVKAALNLLGFAVGAPRLPMDEATEDTKKRLAKAMSDFGFDIQQEIR
ncbi:MAG: 4-hydroxy-tetrahydrodipicolinate synthase [Eubacteriales bacterium]